MNDLLQNEIVAKVLGGEGAEIVRCLDLLEICMEVLETAGIDRRLSSERFMLLKPGEAFDSVDVRVYRHHVGELITRFELADEGERTDVCRLDRATLAEVLVGLMHASLVAPLTRDGSMLYHYCFEEIFGKAIARDVFDGYDSPRERWAGQLSEELGEARRKVKTGRPQRAA